MAKFIAFNIERALNSLHPQSTDEKKYFAKARSLASNLKNNEVLNSYFLLWIIVFDEKLFRLYL